MKNISNNIINNDIKGDIMKHILTKEKPIHIKESAIIKKATNYSYRVTIPKTIIEAFPELKEDAKLVFDIKQTSLNDFECDITFNVKGISIADVKKSAPEPTPEIAPETVKKSAPTIDKPKEKTEKNQVKADATSKDANNKLDVNKFKDVPLADGKYIIKVTTPSEPKLRIRDDEIKEDITSKLVGNKTEDEVKQIIESLISIENPSAEKLKDELDKFRGNQYRK